MVFMLDSHYGVVPGGGDMKQIVKDRLRVSALETSDDFALLVGKKTDTKFGTTVAVSMNRKAEMKREDQLNKV